MSVFSRQPITAPDALDADALRRAAAFAAQAHIPSVSLVGTVLPTEVTPEGGPNKQVFVDGLSMAVTPIAIVDLDSTNPVCRVPYAAPGNFTTTFESRVAHCGELPTGLYGASVLAGAAGGKRVREDDENVSESGLRFEGARLSGQAWTIPNELASEAQIGAGNTLASQGPQGLLRVIDDAPSKTASCDKAPDPTMPMFVDGGLAFAQRTVKYRAKCEGDESPFSEDDRGIDGTSCLPEVCCAAVEHLCGLDLCEEIEVGGARFRKNPLEAVGSVDVGGKEVLIPSCVPFEMPRQCCPPK
jgi:hypothetical protein